MATDEKPPGGISRFLAEGTVPSLLLLAGVIWSASQLSANSSDSKQRLATIEAQALGPRVTALEAEFGQLKLEHEKLVDSVHGIDVNLQSVNDGIKSLNEKIGALADQAFAGRRK